MLVSESAHIVFGILSLFLLLLLCPALAQIWICGGDARSQGYSALFCTIIERLDVFVYFYGCLLDIELIILHKGGGWCHEQMSWQNAGIS